MKKVKITVIETSLNKELVDKYATPGLTACTYNTPGMVFLYKWLAKAKRAL